ncbi:hypothetical protein [Nitrospira sp. M1]
MWSSYPAYIGQHPHPSWLTCEYILRAFATRRRVETYKAYVAEGIDEEIRTFYAKKKQPPILGSDAFKQTLKLRNKDIDVPGLREARVRPTVNRIVEVSLSTPGCQAKERLGLEKRANVVQPRQRHDDVHLSTRSGHEIK